MTYYQLAAEWWLLVDERCSATGQPSAEASRWVCMRKSCRLQVMHRVNVLLPGLSGTRKHSARSIILTMNMTHEVKQPNGSGLCARTFPCTATSSHVSSPCCLVMLTRSSGFLLMKPLNIGTIVGPATSDLY